MRRAGLALWVFGGEKRSVWRVTADLFLWGEMIRTTVFTAGFTSGRGRGWSQFPNHCFLHDHLHFSSYLPLPFPRPPERVSPTATQPSLFPFREFTLHGYNGVWQKSRFDATLTAFCTINPIIHGDVSKCGSELSFHVHVLLQAFICWPVLSRCYKQLLKM